MEQPEEAEIHHINLPQVMTKSEKLNSMVFSDSQKIAYVGICYLLVRAKTLTSKTCVQSYDTWASQFLEKLFTYLEILPQERLMLQNLVEHNVLADDLAANILSEVVAATESMREELDAKMADVRYTILSHMFILSISDGFYDSRSRSLIKNVAVLLRVPAHDIILLENVIGDQLRLHDMNEKLAQEDQVVEKRNKLESRNRWLFAGLATVAGGAVIGLTAGLAAPLIGSGIVAALGSFGVTGAGVTGFGTFMATTGGVALVTSGGVLTGGGMSGSKMMKRTRGIEEFYFVGIEEALQNIYTNKENRAQNRKEKNKSELLEEEHQRQREALQEARRLPQPVEEDNDLLWDAEEALSGIHDAASVDCDQYSLIYETDVLKKLGTTMSILLAEVASTIFQQGLQATALPVLLGALTAPMWLIKLTYLIDNPWSNALTKAEKVGRLLADSLIGQAQGNRPVTLVGFSIGARVIYYCLLELASKHKYGIVEDVFLIGTPIISSEKEWAKVSNVVSGTITSGYATNDTMLRILYRASSTLWNCVPGLVPMNNAHVKDVDLTDLVDGHMSYPASIPKILKRFGFEVFSETYEDQSTEKEDVKAEPKEAAKTTPADFSHDIIEDEIKQMSHVDDMMAEYWKPRELNTSLDPLVISDNDLISPKELPTTLSALIIDINNESKEKVASETNSDEKQ